ncbi:MULTISPECIES: S1C family serine protease [Paenibacillus]|uniref:Trypsin n=2 Tax=Paenibacillus TaxID=44249 RepID=A0A1R1EE94_9BACL|nr:MULTISPECIES: trypsin-like peptidase domain-containing protein [Paenibacillus]MBJ9993156.1 trypsin-like peptidase domain-containing protein [Paenibacillus sp. S28]MEC0174633.1 trypsin-like peptidase domain-containing protein [Paenibacillus favisporus]OMF50145.1 trypsin [Paenibacillus rhizosphaerae]OXL87080.1 trypsin [Paenibacillus sp. SSG-1]UYO05160.1 trypsin-like peptidase domain-containing protein [Paenibacillus sp. PSB04]
MKPTGKKWVITLLSTIVLVSGSAAAEAQSTGKTATAASKAGQAAQKAKTAASSASTAKKVNVQVAADPVPQIVKDISPSVVGIIGRSTDTTLTGGATNRYNLAHGTGVIVKSNGWIVTNAHVVNGLEGTLVVTSDGKSYSIVDSYIDETSDIALIKINAKSLVPAVFAKSAQTAQVGEKVIAIGTPISFSLRNSATVGVVSGLNRGVNAFYRLIQSDTAINPGNSGGPLVNMRGEVIGINSLKFAAVGVENMGFSIPSDTVQYVMGQLFKYGEVKRPSLGFNMEESWSAIVGLPTDDPLTVTKVFSDQAKKAGIQEDDVLYSINGKRVTSVVDINEMFKSFLPGQTVKLLMQSGGDIVERKLVLSQAGADGDAYNDESGPGEEF